ncbi:MAG: transglycosylase SLT domain-containing protein, partial [Vicinamibacteria bacterium]
MRSSTGRWTPPPIREALSPLTRRPALAALAGAATIAFSAILVDLAAVAPATAGSRPMPAAMAELVARRAVVRQVIVEEARRFGVPPAFALAVAWQESGWQQGVVSSAGAIGVMQLLPTTA